MPPGELIYLNLPLHPGSKLDKPPPTPPTSARRVGGEHGLPRRGADVEAAGTDDNWVSYYEIFRGGVAIDKVAKGTYYFDHSAGRRRQRSVRSAHGGRRGQRFEKAASTPAAGKPATSFDDAAPVAPDRHLAASRRTFSPPTPARSLNPTPKATPPTWRSRASACSSSQARPQRGQGRDPVSTTATTARPFDAFSADDIWGVGVYRKEFPPPANTRCT